MGTLRLALGGAVLGIVRRGMTVRLNLSGTKLSGRWLLRRWRGVFSLSESGAVMDFLTRITSCPVKSLSPPNH